MSFSKESLFYVVLPFTAAFHSSVTSLSGAGNHTGSPGTENFWVLSEIGEDMTCALHLQGMPENEYLRLV